ITAFTMSTVKNPEASGFHKKSFYMFFIDPYNFLRAFMLGFWDIFLELRGQRRQRKRDVQPRLEHRGLRYALLRAAITTIIRELSVYTLIGDMFAGVPSAYVTLFGYDEVAHHSGVEREDTLEVLRKLDQQFERLETASRQAPRPYDFVILSDHGQSQGATFKQRYDITLEEYVEQLVAGKVKVETAGAVAEHWSYLSAPLTDAIQGDQRQLSAKALRLAVKNKTSEGEVMLGPERKTLKDKKEKIAGENEEAIVMASGNLGLIYFTDWKERMTLEQIDEAFPGLLQGLVNHPGIGFVMVRSADKGPLAIGAGGIFFLEEDRFQGKNPLAHFGANAAGHLKRTDGFPHVADIMVNSFYDPVTDEVAAFEELVGSHGGLGGDQAHPFVLFPAGWELPEKEIIGAEHLNRVMRGWLASVKKHGGNDGKD
ncbi:MAG TPA: phage holin family protein, partial [Actinobacteria bacterium]|nr:phage holin family protein [Actinomycetota bacterium]